MNCSRIRQNSEAGHDSIRSLTTSATGKGLTQTGEKYNKARVGDTGHIARLGQRQGKTT